MVISRSENNIYDVTELLINNWNVEFHHYSIDEVVEFALISISGKEPSSEVDLTAIKQDFANKEDIKQAASDAVNRIQGDLREQLGLEREFDPNINIDF